MKENHNIKVVSLDDLYFATTEKLYNPDDKSWFDNQGIK